MTGTKTMRLLFMVAILTLPRLAAAEEMWRWQDATGRIHYSNVAGHIPDNAVPVSGRIGIIAGPVAGPVVKRMEAGPRAAEGQGPSLMPQASACVPYFCPGLAIPYTLTINGHDLADQVKEAALLDALHVRWRGLCQ